MELESFGENLFSGPFPLIGKCPVMRADKVYRKYFLSCIGLLFSVFAMTAAFNSYFDPLLLSGSVCPGNRFVPVIDTRLQKTNRLYHGGERYDALLLGSSRAEQFRQ